MKTIKTIVLVMVLGMFGYVYAGQSSQPTTQDARPAATHCKMCAKDAGCCVPGAECCKEGAECCKKDCCSEGERCKTGEDCCKAASCCSAAKTADSKHEGHAARHNSSNERASCSKAKDDSKTGCCASGCSIDKATKK